MSKRSRSVSLTLMSLAPMLLAACSQGTPPSPLAEKPKPKGPTAYETVDDCVFDGNDRATCQKGYETARTEALANAPRFATGEECALEFENCQKAPEAPAVATTAAPTGATPSTAPAAAPTQAGSSGFMPLMAGFMIGQAMSNSGGGAGYASAGFDGRRDDDRRTTASGGGASSSSVLYRARGGQLSQVSSLSSGARSVEPVRARTVTSAQVASAKASQARAAQARAAQARANTSARSVSRSGFGGRSGGFGG